MDESKQKRLIGERIRVARERLRLNQSDLAEYLNVSQNTVSNYEKGLSLIKVTDVTRLAHFLKVSVGYLLGETETINEYQAALSTISPALKPTALKLLRALGDATDDIREYGVDLSVIDQKEDTSLR